MIQDMVKKGCYLYMQMYPALARDIFQVGCLAAIEKGGEEDGAMMLRIKGAVKNFLNQQSTIVKIPIATRVDIRTKEFDERDFESNSIKSEEDYYREAIEAVKLFKTSGERERKILHMIALGYRHTEIAEDLGFSPQLLRYYFDKIRRRNGHH